MNSIFLLTTIPLLGLMGAECLCEIAQAPQNQAREGTIAFVSGQESGPGTSIYTTDSAATQVKRLPNTDGATFLNMDEKGRSIVFLMMTEDTEEAEIYSISTDGSNKRRLTKNQFSDYDACFNFDGSKIAFASERGNSNEIYLMNSDGSAQKRLTFHNSIKSSPSFSPDGKQIAFTSVTSKGETPKISILIINADGSGLHRFTNSADYTDTVWHPDGSSILATNDKDMVIFPLDGSRPKHLPVQGFSASWSFDGQQIIFNQLSDLNKTKSGSYVANYNVFIMDADGHNIHPLISNRRADKSVFSVRWPCWGGRMDKEQTKIAPARPDSTSDN